MCYLHKERCMECICIETFSRSSEDFLRTNSWEGFRVLGDLVYICSLGASQEALGVKNLPANAADIRDEGSIPRSRRCPRGEQGSPLQCSCLKSLIDRGARRATVCRIAKHWTRRRRLSTHSSLPYSCRSSLPGEMS